MVRFFGNASMSAYIAGGYNVPDISIEPAVLANKGPDKTPGSSK